MLQATLDILDAELRKDHDNYVNLPDHAHWATFRQETTVSPKFWQEFYPKVAAHSYSWKHAKYTSLAHDLDAETSALPGIYYFYVRPDQLIENMPQFVFYVGISGEGDSARPVRDRLRDYLNIEKIKKRESVHFNLQRYYPFAYVAYALLALSGSQLASLEEAFHGFFYPWGARRDFPAKIKASQKAWGKI